MLRFGSLLLFCIASLLACESRASDLEIDKQRSIFRVQVAATGHSFEVELKDYVAKISLDSEGQVDSATFSFAPQALDSGNKKRDRKMLQWLDEKSYPKIGFVLQEVRNVDGGTLGIGTLTLYGQSRAIEVPFELTTEGEVSRLSGRATIDYRDFGLEVISLLFVRVKPVLEVRFELVGSFAASTR